MLTYDSSSSSHSANTFRNPKHSVRVNVYNRQFLMAL
jgi:hypothetical protein